MQIKNIIFDLGHVIIDVNEGAIQKELTDKVTDLTQLHQHMLKNEIYTRLETGHVSPQQFRDEVRKFLKTAATDKEIDQAWNSMIGSIHPDRILLLNKLNQKYRTFILSNTNEIHLKYYGDYVRNTYGMNLEDLFEKAYYSHEIGSRKPDTAPFEHVLSDGKMDPFETLFIDDKLENIEAARKADILGYQLNEGIEIMDLFDRELGFRAF